MVSPLDWMKPMLSHAVVFNFVVFNLRFLLKFSIPNIVRGAKLWSSLILCISRIIYTNSKNRLQISALFSILYAVRYVYRRSNQQISNDLRISQLSLFRVHVFKVILASVPQLRLLILLTHRHQSMHSMILRLKQLIFDGLFAIHDLVKFVVEVHLAYPLVVFDV